MKKLIYQLFALIVLAGCGAEKPAKEEKSAEEERIEEKAKYTEDSRQSYAVTIANMVEAPMEACFEQVRQMGDMPLLFKLCTDATGLQVFSVRKVAEGDEYGETYALHEDKLIYATEFINYNYADTANSQRWECEYALNGMEIIDFVSLGHGETEQEDWKPESIFKQWEGWNEKYLELKGQ